MLNFCQKSGLVCL